MKILSVKLTNKQKLRFAGTFGIIAIGILFLFLALNGVLSGNHRSNSAIPGKDILYMTCNQLDLELNTYFSESLQVAKTDPTLSAAYDRQANTLLAIYNYQNCFNNQTSSGG